MGRARDAGALGVVCVGESLAAALRAQELANRYPGFLNWTAGVHPHDAAAFDPVRDIAAIRAAISEGAVAVGECGLDYHYDHSPRPLQRRAFADQLALAGETARPVVVHSRDAEEDSATMIREAGTAGIGGVMHCFTGSRALAEVALAAGWYISFSGIATFAKWDAADIVRLVPDDRLLIESDSPYLAPVPHRGKRNEPAWCAATMSRLADVRGTTSAALGVQTVANTRRLFALS